MKLYTVKCPCGCDNYLVRPLFGCQCSSLSKEEAEEVVRRYNAPDALFNGIWAAETELLLDRRWQARVIAAESCIASDWAEADTPAAAIQAAIDLLPDNDD